MELNEDNLHRYKNGYMSVDEMLDFEELLEANPDINRQLSGQNKDLFLENINYNKEQFKEISQVEISPEKENGIFIWLKNARRSVPVLALFMLVFGLGWYFINKPPVPSAELVNQVANTGLSTSELGGVHAGGTTEDPTAADTLCNCGEELLRTRFLSDSQNKNDFNQYVDAFKPGNSYQKQCRTYWKGWVYMSRQAYQEAIPVFEEIRSQQSANALSQRAGHALMIAYLATNKVDEALDISHQLLKEGVHDQLAYDFAKEVDQKLGK